MLAQMGKSVSKQEQKMSELGQTEQDILTSVKAAKDGVTETARQMRDIIDKHERDLHGDLDRCQREALVKLGSNREETTINKTKTLTLKQEVAILCQSRNTIDKLVRAPIIQEQFDATNKSDGHTMDWKLNLERNHQTKESLKAMLGDIKLNLAQAMSTGKITLGEPVSKVQLKYEGGYIVAGMVVIEDCLAVIHYNDQVLCLYDMENDRHKEVNFAGLHKARGMALVSSSDGTVVITDEGTDGGKLHFVKISTNFSLTHLRVKKLPVKDTGSVSVSRETGELIIAHSSSFIICDQHGDVQRQVNMPDGYLGCVLGIDSRYAVMSYMNGSIRWVDQEGNCSHAYGTEDIDRMKNPRHMITDNERRLIVADSDNNRLHLLDTSGHLSQFLLTKDDGITYPVCIFIDEPSAKLYVAHQPGQSQEVWVYRWIGDSRNTNFRLDVQLNKF